MTNNKIKPLRFGVMCRGNEVSDWQAACIDHLLALPEVRPALIIIDVQNDFVSGALANPYNAGAIVPLCALVRDGSEDSKVQSASALWALSHENAPNKATIAKLGGIDPLLGLLVTGTTERSQECVAGALAALQLGPDALTLGGGPLSAARIVSDILRDDGTTEGDAETREQRRTPSHTSNELPVPHQPCSVPKRTSTTL